MIIPYRFLRWFRLSLFIGLILFILSSCFGDKGPIHHLSGISKELYFRIDPEHPGRGVADYPGNVVSDVPKSYAMVLLAELDRNDLNINSKMPSLAYRAGRWLLDHSDENGDGVIGWGVPIAWDAYGDGSVNPAHTEYTISTAIVVDALLTWAERDAKAPHDEIHSLVAHSLEPYISPIMRTPAGLVPYSLQEADRPYDTFNSAAYLAGQMQRFSRKFVSPELQSRLRDAADETMQVLLGQRQLSPEGNSWFWFYSIQEEVPNDLPHASYIIDGIRTYIAYGGRLADQFDRVAVVNHLRDFPISGKTLRGWPIFNQEIITPARSYDLGIGLNMVCSESATSDIRSLFLNTLSAYRTPQGAYSKYPPHLDTGGVLVVAEYEAYLYRGLMSCIRVMTEELRRDEAPSRVLKTTGEEFNLVQRDIDNRRPVDASIPLLGEQWGAVSFDIDLRAQILTPGTVTIKPSISGVPLRLLPYNGDWLVLLRKYPTDQLVFKRFAADGILQCSTVINQGSDGNPTLRDLAIYENDLYIAYYHNPSSANWLVRLPLDIGCPVSTAKPEKLPTLEDPAGLTYEMIPSLRFVKGFENQLYLIGGTMEAAIYRDSSIIRRIEGCQHIIETIATPKGLAHLCLSSQVGTNGARQPTLVAPQGIVAPKVDTENGVPWRLSWSGGKLHIDYAKTAEQLREMFVSDFLSTQNNGWFEFGINNEEGRIPWSQIYYLNGLLDILNVSRLNPDAQRIFGPILGDVRQRLDWEIDLMDRHYLAGRFKTRAFTIDRSPALFAVQTSRLLLLFKRYLDEVSNPLLLTSMEILTNDVHKLQDHIEVLARSGEEPRWIQPGHAHLRWPKGSKFYFDGLPVPFNHQNEWAYAVAQTSEEGTQGGQIETAQEIIELFIQHIAPEGMLPPSGVWDYWWGRAYDGWQEVDGISVNKPDYYGDKGKAWISFRTIDVMALLAMGPFMEEKIRKNSLDSSKTLAQAGLVYPFVNQSLTNLTGQIHLRPAVAYEYSRLTSPWETPNVVWSLARLAPSEGHRK